MKPLEFTILKIHMFSEGNENLKRNYCEPGITNWKGEKMRLQFATLDCVDFILEK